MDKNWRLLLWFVLAIVSAADAGQRKAPNAIVGHGAPVRTSSHPGIADGTPVYLMLPKGFKVKDVRPGSTVEFNVARPVFWRDRVVVDRGAVVMAKVTEARGSKWPNRGSRLQLEVSGVETTDGRVVPLRATAAMNGGVNEFTVGALQASTSMGTAGAFFLPLAALLAVTTKGSTMNPPAGTMMTAYVSGNFQSEATARTRTDPKQSNSAWLWASSDRQMPLKTVDLYCNGVPLAQIKYDRHLSMQLRPGFYRLAVAPDKMVEFYAVAGEDYYLAVNHTPLEFMLPGPGIRLDSKSPAPTHWYTSPDRCEPLREVPEQ